MMGLAYSLQEVIMAIKKLKDFLDQNNVDYTVIAHMPAYTSQEIAHSAHIPGQQVAKTVVVKIDGTMALAVLPAKYRVALQDLRDITGTFDVQFANEDEFKDIFADCEVGAMPPFGNLYGMDVYVAPELTEDKEIAFNAGTHSELIKMSYRDFERLVRPKLMSFAM